MTDDVLLVPAKEAARRLSMGTSTFWREVGKKTIPQPIKVGGMTRWRVADLQQFVQQPSHPTSASAHGA